MSDAFDHELAQLLADAHEADEARRLGGEVPWWALVILRGVENARRDVETLRQTVLELREPTR